MLFTKDHEWIAVDGEIATVGITAFAAEQLGDVVYVELPGLGRVVSTGESFAVVESVKAASDIYAPVSGVVTAVNEALASAPETEVNWSPRNAAGTIGWIRLVA